MGHVIKLAYTGEPISCEEALQSIFIITEVAVTHLYKVHNGFKVTVAKPEQLTPFLSAEGQRKLADNGFSPVPSPETKAKCTIVAKKIDRTILPRSCESISQEVAAKNGVTVLDVYKPPESRIVKIRFSAPEEAQRILSRGLMMFNTSVPSYNLEPECFIHLEQCLNCYRYGHNKHTCPHIQRCSRCAGEGHFFAKCKESIKCCNCEGSHVAVSGSCPTRKELLKAKRTELRENRNTAPTYATTAATQPIQTSTPRRPTTSSRTTMPTLPQTHAFTPNTNPKIQAILHVSLIAAKYNAKRFATIVPIMLQKNGFPSIVVPEEIFEDDNLYIPEYTTNTETMDNEVTITHPEPHCSTTHRHLVLQPQPQRKPRETVQARDTTRNTEQKRKQTSPLNTHNKKDKKDPPIPQPRRREMDDTILDDDSSGSEIDVEVVPEAEDELHAPVGGATAMLPCRGPLGQRGSVGNWSADSQEFRTASCSQDSLPDLEEPTVDARPRNRYRDQVTPRKVNPGRMGLP